MPENASTEATPGRDVACLRGLFPHPVYAGLPSHHTLPGVDRSTGSYLYLEVDILEHQPTSHARMTWRRGAVTRLTLPPVGSRTVELVAAWLTKPVDLAIQRVGK